MRMRLPAILVLTVACAPGCASSPVARSFAELPRHLEPGDAIRVTERTGATTTGRLQTLRPTSLTFYVFGKPYEVPELQVIKLQRRDRAVGRGALIGLGAGFGIGLIAAGSMESSGNPLVDTQAAGATVLISMGLGTAVGALVGARVRVDRTVYQVLPKTLQPDASAAKHFGHVREIEHRDY